jgi:hypothetical protein
MPRFVDELKQDYQAHRGHVVTFDWTPQKVTFDPITPNDLVEANRSDPTKGEPSPFEIKVNLLIRKAKNADTGEPLFAPGDKHFLMNEAMSLRIGEMADRMMTIPSLAEAKAAVAADPTSASDSSSPTSSDDSSAK